MLKGIKTGDVIYLMAFKKDTATYTTCNKARVWFVSEEEGILDTNYGEFVVNNIMQGLEGPDGDLYEIYHTERELDEGILKNYRESVESANNVYRGQIDICESNIQQNLGHLEVEERKFLDKWGKVSQEQK